MRKSFQKLFQWKSENNGMYKFALVSSDFYNFSDILLKVDKNIKNSLVSL